MYIYILYPGSKCLCATCVYYTQANSIIYIQNIQTESNRKLCSPGIRIDVTLQWSLKSAKWFSRNLLWSLFCKCRICLLYLCTNFLHGSIEVQSKLPAPLEHMHLEGKKPPVHIALKCKRQQALARGNMQNRSVPVDKEQVNFRATQSNHILYKLYTCILCYILQIELFVSFQAVKRSQPATGSGSTRRTTACKQKFQDNFPKMASLLDVFLKCCCICHNFFSRNVSMCNISLSAALEKRPRRAALKKRSKDLNCRESCRVYHTMALLCQSNSNKMSNVFKCFTVCHELCKTSASN